MSACALHIPAWLGVLLWLIAVPYSTFSSGANAQLSQVSERCVSLSLPVAIFFGMNGVSRWSLGLRYASRVHQRDGGTCAAVPFGRAGAGN